MTPIVMTRPLRHFWTIGSMAALIALVLSPTAASAGPSANLVAGLNDHFTYVVPASVNTVSGSATLNGTQGWDVDISDNNLRVTNPMIAITSTGPASDFPAIGTVGPRQATLIPGSDYWSTRYLQSSYPVKFTTGYTVTVAYSPAAIPRGGANQSFTITMKPLKPIAPTQGLKITPNFNAGTLIRVTPPSNLNQGETSGSGDNSYWWVNNPVVGKTYTYTFLLHVANQSAKPIANVPGVLVEEGQTSANTNEGSMRSLTVPDPVSFGRITFTYSVGQSATWQLTHSSTNDVNFLGHCC